MLVIMDKMIQNYANWFHLKFLTINLKWAFHAVWQAHYIFPVALFSTLLDDSLRYSFFSILQHLLWWPYFLFHFKAEDNLLKFSLRYVPAPSTYNHIHLSLDKKDEHFVLVKRQLLCLDNRFQLRSSYVLRSTSIFSSLCVNFSNSFLSA